MKKISSLFIALFVLLSLSACQTETFDFKPFSDALNGFVQANQVFNESLKVGKVEVIDDYHAKIEGILASDSLQALKDSISNLEKVDIAASSLEVQLALNMITKTLNQYVNTIETKLNDLLAVADESELKGLITEFDDLKIAETEKLNELINDFNNLVQGK